MVEPRVPELPDQLIDLGLVTTAARTLDVVHPAQSPGSDRIGNHGDHRTLTLNLSSHQSRTLATLRDTLLPKLLSGELSVAVAVESSANC